MLHDGVLVSAEIIGPLAFATLMFLRFFARYSGRV